MDVGARVSPALVSLRRRIRLRFTRTEAGYERWMRLFHGVRPAPDLVAQVADGGSAHAVLRSRAAWQEVEAEVRRLGLPRHPDPPKNWDSLLALRAILGRVPRDGRVLDAGAELYSAILPWLHLCGYRRLDGINLVFEAPFRQGPIDYRGGDLTRTPFADGSFDAITCLSVIEHGVDLDAYFREASRLLRPGGLLVTSTDYWQDPVDTGGQVAYGVPIRIFTRDALLDAVALAGRHGLAPTASLDASMLACAERAVRWQRFGLDYTFAFFTLAKA
jgi:SAM-dependent methyltransferase